ncbi:hypothetical protein J4434_01310 [Candidatus Woesearchaeota archaeon]|nr:hypothetical protein [Candidatus Woesearchaeota archaeon]
MEEIMKHVNDGSYIQKKISEWEFIVEEQIAIEKKLTNLGKMSNEELIGTLRKIKAVIESSWEIGIMIELFDPDSEGIIMELLNKYDKNNISQKEFQMLCLPEILTYIQKELLSLYEIAEKKDYGQLDEHARRFFWIKNTWADTVVLDKNFFRAKIARLEEEGINFRLELEKIYENLNNLKKERKRILENKTCSVKIRRAVEFFEIMTLWRERRKKYALISNHYLNLFAKEISKRSNVKHELLMYSYADELELPMDETFVEELRKREKICLQYVDEQGIHFVSGKVVEDFVEEIKGMTEQQVARLYGNVANPGKVEGIAKIIFITSDMIKMEKGDILVSPCTRPEYVPAMKKASAIITDEGGITSHAAIVSRELGVPCIVGLRNATDVIKDGDLILVNANHGIVQIMKRKG